MQIYTLLLLDIYILYLYVYFFNHPKDQKKRTRPLRALTIICLQTHVFNTQAKIWI